MRQSPPGHRPPGQNPEPRRADRRLRFVFPHAVVSMGLRAEPTFGEIAEALGALADRAYGAPVAIDVTVSLPREGRPRQRQPAKFLALVRPSALRKG